MTSSLREIVGPVRSVVIEKPNRLGEVRVESSCDPPPGLERATTVTAQHPKHGEPVEPGPLGKQLVAHVGIDAHLVECRAERVEVRLPRYMHSVNLAKMHL